MGLGFQKKNRGHTASDLGFSYLSLYQDPLSNEPWPHFGGQPISRRLLILGPSNSAQRALLGLVLDCQMLASINQEERKNSLVASILRSVNC